YRGLAADGRSASGSGETSHSQEFVNFAWIAPPREDWASYLHSACCSVWIGTVPRLVRCTLLRHGGIECGERARRTLPFALGATQDAICPMGSYVLRWEVSMISKAFPCMNQCSDAIFTSLCLSFLLTHGFPSAAQNTKPEESTGEKIKRALSAGPPSITHDATVAEIDSDGTMKILRQGTNEFTCMPGDPAGIGMPAMCADKVAMQWNSDFEHHKTKPSTTDPGIEYMLAGATQRS